MKIENQIKHEIVKFAQFFESFLRKRGFFGSGPALTRILCESCRRHWLHAPAARARRPLRATAACARCMRTHRKSMNRPLFSNLTSK